MLSCPPEGRYRVSWSKTTVLIPKVSVFRVCLREDTKFRLWYQLFRMSSDFNSKRDNKNGIYYDPQYPPRGGADPEEQLFRRCR